jgi:hypothetical protein
VIDLDLDLDFYRVFEKSSQIVMTIYFGNSLYCSEADTTHHQLKCALKSRDLRGTMGLLTTIGTTVGTAVLTGTLLSLCRNLLKGPRTAGAEVDDGASDEVLRVRKKILFQALVALLTTMDDLLWIGTFKWVGYLFYDAERMRSLPYPDQKVRNAPTIFRSPWHSKCIGTPNSPTPQFGLSFVLAATKRRCPYQAAPTHHLWHARIHIHTHTFSLSPTLSLSSRSPDLHLSTWCRDV